MTALPALAASIQAAAVLQLAIAAVNLALPSRLRYRENLDRVSLIVRQVFIVHSMYIVLVLVIFASLSLGYAEELAAGRGLGRAVSAALAVFWLPRVFVQLFYYDRDLCRGNLVWHVIFTLAFAYLGVVYAVAAFRS